MKAALAGPPAHEAPVQRAPEAHPATTSQQAPAAAFARAELYGHSILGEPSPGHPLPSPVQRKMERAFGADFSRVRIHRGAHVEHLGAAAYTRGHRIHFAPGEGNLGSPQGQAMLGHELAHVVQQRQGRARGGAASALNEDPRLEAEADTLGARAARGEPVHGGAAGGGPGEGAVQRSGGDRSSVQLARCGACAARSKSGGDAPSMEMPVQRNKRKKKAKQQERAEAYRDRQQQKQGIRELGRQEFERRDILDAQPPINPATRSDEDPVTRDLALRQTSAARKLLHQPGPEFQQEIGAAAGQLRSVLRGLTKRDQKAMGARLFGSEGLMPGKKPRHLLKTLGRVAGGARSASGADREATVALMGDIGALYADTGATTGVEGRSAEDAERLRGALSSGFTARGLSAPTDSIVKQVQAVGGSSAVGPTKKKERTRPPNAKPPRTGIHNLGAEVDESLGIPEDARLPTSRWDVAHISSRRVADTAEPLAGHMSGSPAEILHVWDMLRGERGDRQYVGALREHQKRRRDDPNRLPMAHLSPAAQKQRMARAAGASAFLVGGGYHSAVETAEGTLAYSGQNLRDAIEPNQDAGHLLGQGAATSLVSELLEDYTADSSESLRLGGTTKQNRRKKKQIARAVAYQERQQQKRSGRPPL